MRIKRITSQHRRDFTAILECEHCGHEQELTSGYDDTYYHKKVIPEIECERCSKKASGDYRPLATKYADGKTV